MRVLPPVGGSRPAAPPDFGYIARQWAEARLSLPTWPASSPGGDSPPRCGARGSKTAPVRRALPRRQLRTSIAGPRVGHLHEYVDETRAPAVYAAHHRHGALAHDRQSGLRPRAANQACAEDTRGRISAASDSSGRTPRAGLALSVVSDLIAGSPAAAPGLREGDGGRGSTGAAPSTPADSHAGRPRLRASARPARHGRPRIVLHLTAGRDSGSIDFLVRYAPG